MVPSRWWLWGVGEPGGFGGAEARLIARCDGRQRCAGISPGWPADHDCRERSGECPIRQPVRHAVDGDRPVVLHPTRKPARELHRTIAVCGEGLGAPAAVVWLALSDPAEETHAGSDGRAEWFDQIDLTPCQPRDLVVDVDAERGGRPGWPVDRNLYQPNVRAHGAEDLEQRLTVGGLPRQLALRTGAPGADGSGHSCQLPSRPAQLDFPVHPHAADPARPGSPVKVYRRG
jgi:hypothetical protein